MQKLFKKIRDAKSGATAIEYGLILALISVVLITSLGALSNTIQVKFNVIRTAMN